KPAVAVLSKVGASRPRTGDDPASGPDVVSGGWRVGVRVRAGGRRSTCSGTDPHAYGDARNARYPFYADLLDSKKGANCGNPIGRGLTESGLARSFFHAPS